MNFPPLMVEIGTFTQSTLNWSIGQHPVRVYKWTRGTVPALKNLRA